MSSPVRQQAGVVTRSASSGLAEIVELILDKGLVIDAFVRVSLIGIEVLSIEARIVVASVDTYLRYAEAINQITAAGTRQGGAPAVGRRESADTPNTDTPNTEETKTGETK